MVNFDDIMQREWKVPSNLIPKVLFHITPKTNVDSIKKSGIRTSSKRSTATGTIRGVYLTDDVMDVIMGGDAPRGPLSVLAVNPKGLVLYFDQEFLVDYKEEKELYAALKNREASLHCYSKTSIPSNRIASVSDFDPKKRTYG